MQANKQLTCLAMEQAVLSNNAEAFAEVLIGLVGHRSSTEFLQQVLSVLDQDQDRSVVDQKDVQVQVHTNAHLQSNHETNQRTPQVQPSYLHVSSYFLFYFDVSSGLILLLSVK